MTIEPSAVRFTFGARVLPPKPEPTTARPLMSIEEDAKRINARTRKAWGETGNQHFGKTANAVRTAAARERDAELTPVILDILRSNTRTSRREIMRVTGLSCDVVRRILDAMQEKGTVTYHRTAPKGWSIE